MIIEAKLNLKLIFTFKNILLLHQQIDLIVSFNSYDQRWKNGNK